MFPEGFPYPGAPAAKPGDLVIIVLAARISPGRGGERGGAADLPAREPEGHAPQGRNDRGAGVKANSADLERRQLPRS